jgi:hypothetical protein
VHPISEEFGLVAGRRTERAMAEPLAKKSLENAAGKREGLRLAIQTLNSSLGSIREYDDHDEGGRSALRILRNKLEKLLEQTKQETSK